MRKQRLVLLLLALTPTVLLAADNPWAGTWKLDVSRSHFAGYTFSYSKNANGMMVYDDGSPEPFTFAIDGKPYTDAEGNTHTWTTDGDHAWNSVAKHGDVETTRAHRVLSPDGKTFTMTFSGTKPDGTTFADTTVYTRVSGSAGMEGTWRSAKVTISSPSQWIISYPAPDTFQWDIPDYKTVTTGKMDGSDLPITGPTMSPTTTLSVQQNTPQKFTTTVKNHGKVLSLSEDNLSNDGKTITEYSWTPGKESEKTTAIYVR